MRSAARAEHRLVHSQHHQYGHGQRAAAPPGRLKRLAFWATLLCLAGCAVGEVLGLVIGTVLGRTNLEAFAPAAGLGFVFGCTFTMVLLLRKAIAWRLAA